MSDEFTRIDGILQRLHASSPKIEVGNGDDAAVLRIDGSVVLSVDAAVDGTHFQRPWLTFDALGYRSAVAALSDLAAMGADPSAMLSSVVVPSDMSDDDLYAIAEGYARAAREHGAPVLGGNLSGGSQLSLTTTVIGSIQGKAMLRSGARPDDVIYVTGYLGAAALGLSALTRGLADAALAPFVERWRAPTPRLREGAALRSVASAAIDVSDGLLQDLSHLCQASNAGAVIDVEQLPLLAGGQQAARILGVSEIDLALSGGEDYELLFTAGDHVRLPVPATAIGRIVAGRAITVREGGQTRAAPTHTGFRHFE